MNAPPIGTTYPTRDAMARGVEVPAATYSVRGPRRLGLIGSAVAVLFLMIGLLSALAPSASAKVAGATVDQCNGIDNGGGRELKCTVTITNVLNLATGVHSSSGTTQICRGAAKDATCGPKTPITQLSTVVRQCNGSALGGGANLTCSVLVTNRILGDGSTSAATVNQCVGSGAEGTAPTTACNPTSSTTGADITQCNGSANGGGASRRVTCTVNPSTVAAAIPITIDQCNGSAADGSTVTCTAQIVNNFVTVPPPTTTPSSTTAPTTTASSTTGPTGTPTRPRSSTTVRPTVATRPTTAASVTTTARATSSSARGRTTTATSRNNTASAVNHATSTSTNGVATGATTTSSSTTTSLASTGVPAARQALLAFALLAAGVALMLVGRRPRWIGKHR